MLPDIYLPQNKNNLFSGTCENLQLSAEFCLDTSTEMYVAAATTTTSITALLLIYNVTKNRETLVIAQKLGEKFLADHSAIF